MEVKGRDLVAGLPKTLTVTSEEIREALQEPISAIVDAISEEEKKAKVQIRRVEGKDGGKWILIDLGDVIVHVFSTSERAFYNLEKLWSDAPLVAISDWIDE